MKKLLITMIICSVGLLGNVFENIDTFTSNVKEETLINGQWREKVYSINIEYPNKVIKEVLEPELNKGEKVLYIDEKKWIYYPLFEEAFEEELDGEENYLLKTMKNIREGVGERVEVEGKIKTLKLDENITLTFKNYEKIGEEEFPLEIEVKDNGILISLIKFDKVSINHSINEKVFELDI